MSDQTTQESATTPEDAAPEMWVPDEPTSADAMARPEAADDAQGETPDVEATEEVEAEAGEEKPVAEAPKPPGMDKALQKMQQRQTTFERQLTQRFDQLGDTIKGVLDEIKSQGGRATTEQKETLQEAKSDLTALFQKAKSAEILDGETFVEVIQAVMQQGRGSVDPETKQTLAAIQQKLEANERLTAQQAEQQQAAQQWEAIKKANPGVDADALKLKAWEGIDDRYPDFDEAQKRAIAAERFDLMLAAAKTTPKPTKIDPASTTPPKSTKGTQTVPSGASTGRSAAPAAKPKPPLWVPD